MTLLLQQHNLLPEQIELINRVYATLNDDNFLQSYLLVGSRHLISFDFIQTFVNGIFCPDMCGFCKNCKLIGSSQHPDYLYVSNFDSNNIKIDSIRDLQLNIYKSLSIAKYKIVVIHPADKLNIQAASALLKILEEPPAHTIFILCAENIMTLPVTIISRCHKYFLHDYSLSDKNYSDLDKCYPHNDERYILLSNLDKLLPKLISLTANKANVVEIAADFQEFKLENVLWFLYILTAETIKVIINKFCIENKLLFIEFAKTQDLFSLFKQLDQINSCLKNNISYNNTLCISNILLGYKKC